MINLTDEVVLEGMYRSSEIQGQLMNCNLTFRLHAFK